MPKSKKDTRQRRRNAQKMNEIIRERKTLGEVQNSSLALPTSQTHDDDHNRRERKTLGEVQFSSIALPSTSQTHDDHNRLVAINPELNLLHSSETVENIDEMVISNEKEPEITEKVIERRIIDVSYFLSKLKEISSHGPFGCSIAELDLIAETRNGLQSKFTFKCRLCNVKFTIESDNCRENYLPINTCAVAGAIAIGAGYSQLAELLSAINLPVLSEDTYTKNHDLVSNKWEAVSVESMKQAAEKERKNALTNNKTNKDGIPIIEVIADGCWSKRSYKKNYNALSGAAAIIGKHTGEVLFLGVKNKYCSVCARAAKENVDPAQHKCFKNYDSPSTTMESEIIVEGFKESIKMHNLIYGKLISDGDSSTYSKILQARPYPDITVEKIECRNHILRNMCNKLQALSTDTKYNLKYRKLITKSAILKTRQAICKFIKKHKTNSDVQLLFEDLLISHLHGFGDHSKCHSNFCNEVGQTNLSNDFFLSALWQKICFIVQNVAAHARSLIYDVDSNAVERYHSIVAKLVGGKRVNFSKKNSYQLRCHAAVVSFNEKKCISRLYKSINKAASPLGKIKRLEMQRIHKNERRRLRRKPKSRCIQKVGSKEDQHYGQDCLKPDMQIDVLNTLKERFIENLKKTDEQRQIIERQTILQGQSSEWLELRRSLLTASNFGKIITRRNDTSCHNIVRDLLYKNNLDHVSSIKHGKENEQIAIKQLENQEKIRIEPCGLFIDSDLPFLGAFPDGICGTDTIIELKCPITAFKLGLDEAIKKRKVTFWKASKNGLEINRNHQWYYQIQGQLHITKRLKCLFAVWSNSHTEIKTEVIERDDGFWSEKMVTKLTSFYLDCILPELVDPRFPRGMLIRNPIYIEDAIKERNKKSKENIQPVDDVIEETNEIEKTAQDDEEPEVLYDFNMPTCSRYLNFEQF